MQTFSGLLDGILADGVVNREEIGELRDWIIDNRQFESDLAFRQLLSAASQALADGRLDPEEVEDLRWLCASASSKSDYFNEVTHEIQRFHGILHGMLSDRRLSEKELRMVLDWIDENQHLRGCYPLTEVEAVIVGVLRDGVLSGEEEESLRQVFETFCAPSENYAVKRMREDRPKLSIRGICAVDPEIVVEGRQFCFTGISPLRPREHLHAMVKSRGGVPRDSVVEDLDYLVICEAVNDAWAFCSYGRKVERAMNLRRAGGKVLVIREHDLKDSLG